MATTVRRWQGARVKQRPWAAPLIIIVVVAVSGVTIAINVAMERRAENFPRVVDMTGDASVGGHGREVTRVSPGQLLDAGANGTLRLEWDDHSVVDLGDGARALVVSDRAKHLRLERGDLGAQLAAQPDGHPCVVDLPGGRVRMSAGQFTAVVDGQAPRTHVRAVLGILHVESAGAPPSDLVAPGDAELGQPAGL
jgi:hypothetical protein